MSRVAKSIETENRLVVVSGYCGYGKEEREMESDY